MCVILVAREKRLGVELLKHAASQNRDGLGMAWRNSGGVRWVKGIDLGTAVQLAQAVPMPYVFHARLATVGGESKELAHPFPVTVSAALDTQGLADEVLFHNGHEHRWREWYRVALLSGMLKPLKGAISDSRVAAAVAAAYGSEVLAEVFEDGKFALLGREKLTLLGKFQEVEKGIEASNTYFLPTKGKDWMDEMYERWWQQRAQDEAKPKATPSGMTYGKRYLPARYASVKLVD